MTIYWALLRIQKTNEKCQFRNLIILSQPCEGLLNIFAFGVTNTVSATATAPSCSCHPASQNGGWLWGWGELSFLLSFFLNNNDFPCSQTRSTQQARVFTHTYCPVMRRGKFRTVTLFCWTTKVPTNWTKSTEGLKKSLWFKANIFIWIFKWMYFYCIPSFLGSLSINMLVNELYKQEYLLKANFRDWVFNCSPKANSKPNFNMNFTLVIQLGHAWPT